MKKYEVEIEGISPYMQHRMRDIDLDAWEKKRGFVIERSDVSKEDVARAEYCAYRDEENGKKLYLPAEHIRGAMIMAGAFMKSKVGNAKKSMKNIVAAMFDITEEKLPLPQEYSIDKRTAVNQNIKARVIVIRPRWDKWSTSFVLTVDNDTITEETIRQLVEYAGSYVGIGSYSPRHNGRYGRFKIIKLKFVNS